MYDGWQGKYQRGNAYIHREEEFEEGAELRCGDVLQNYHGIIRRAFIMGWVLRVTLSGDCRPIGVGVRSVGDTKVLGREPLRSHDKVVPRNPEKDAFNLV